MKLKTKLLPLVGASAVCATVAPLALTSCKTSVSMVELTTKYNSKITDVPAYAKWTIDYANNYYFSHMAQTPAIFADDFYWSMSRSQNQYITSHKENISNVSLKKQQFGDLGQFYTLSFVRNFDITYEWVESGSYTEVTTTKDRTVGSMKFVDIPFWVSPGEDNLWYIRISNALLTQAWSSTSTKYCSMYFNFNRNVVETLKTSTQETSTTKDYNYNYTVNDQDSFSYLGTLLENDNMREMIQNMNNYGYSHYLFSIAPDYDY